MAGPTRVFVPSIYGQHWYGSIYYGGQWVLLIPPPIPPPPPTPPPVQPPPPPINPPLQYPVASPPALLPTIPAGYDIGPVIAQPLDYETILLSWNPPSITANIVDFRVLRSRYGFPVDQNDGTVILDSEVTGWPNTTALYDAEVIPGQMHYYGIYILLQLSTGQTWYRAGFAACLAPFNYGSSDYILSRIPEYFATLSSTPEITTSDPFGNQYLDQFVSVLGWGEDYLRTQVALMAQVNNPQAIPINMLANLAATIGFPYYSEISPAITRDAMSNASALIKERGTLQGIEASITQLTSWGADIRLGYNIMLEEDQSDFLDPEPTPWNSTVSYDIGEYVSYQGYVYQSLVNNNLNVSPPAAAGPPPSNNANWQAQYYSPDPGVQAGPGATLVIPLATSITLGATTVPTVNTNAFPVYLTIGGGTVQDVTVTDLASPPNTVDYGASPGTILVGAGYSVTLTYTGAPTTFVTQTPNKNSFGVYQTVSGGTVTAVWVGGVSTATTSGTYWVPAGSYIGVVASVAPTTFSTTAPVLLNQTTTNLNTWEPLIDLNTHSAEAVNQQNAFVEMRGVLAPITLTGTDNPDVLFGDYLGNGLAVKNVNGSTGNIELRSISRTPSDITAGSTYPNTGQVIGDGIPIPFINLTQLWSSTTEYAPGTIVQYQGVPFIALKANTDVAPPSNGVPTNEWQPIGYDPRIALTLSGYTSQVGTVGGGTQQFACVPYMLWFDETGTFISKVAVPSGVSNGAGARQQIAFASFALPSQWGSTLASSTPDIIGNDLTTWTQQAGTWNVNAWMGGTIVPTSLTAQTLATMAAGANLGANCFVGVTLAAFQGGGGNFVGIVGRWSSNTSYIRVDQTSIVTVNGTTVTVLATHTTPAMPGDRLTVSFNSNTITAYVNGTQVSQVTSAFNNTQTKFGVISDLNAQFVFPQGKTMPRTVLANMRISDRRFPRYKRRYIGKGHTNNEQGINL